jgi:predicted Zn-dependent protease
MKLGREQQAAQGFDTVLEQEPTQHRGQFGAAVLALKQKRKADAFKHLRESYQADPKDVEVGLSLSALLVESGRSKQAREILLPFHRAEPRDARVVKNLAEAFIGVGDYAQALAFFKKYLVLVPDAPNRGSVEPKMLLLESELKS